MITMFDTNEKLMLFFILFFCIKSLLISRLYAVTSNKNSSIFSYNHKIVKQTLIIWAIATFSEYAGYILKCVILCFLNSSVNTRNHGITDYLFSPLFDNPIIAIISFLVSIGLCIALIFLLKKTIQVEKSLDTALIIGFSCAPYFIALPLSDLESAGLIAFTIQLFFIVLFIPYLLYKHFSSLVYRINLKKDKNTIDNRINCILIGFIGECAAILVLALLVTIYGLNLYFASPNYGNPRVASLVFLTAFCAGFLTNAILSFFWSCKPYKSNIKKRLKNVLALSILNAPYILFIVLILSAFV